MPSRNVIVARHVCKAPRRTCPYGESRVIHTANGGDSDSTACCGCERPPYGLGPRIRARDMGSQSTRRGGVGRLRGRRRIVDSAREVARCNRNRIGNIVVDVIKGIESDRTRRFRWRENGIKRTEACRSNKSGIAEDLDSLPLADASDLLAVPKAKI